jgi:mono/diheme cytochrome c family protein
MCRPGGSAPGPDDSTLGQENPEPTEALAPLPLLLLGLLSACILFSAYYLGRYSGGFDPLVYDERTLPGMLESAGPAAPPDPKVVGKRVYMTNCISCHQTTGLGLPGAYPALAGSEWVTGPDERITRVLLSGITGPITVKGTSFNNTMPAFGGLLRDDQLAAVLTYIRSEWGNAAAAVTADKVKEIRAATAGRTGAWTPEELLKLP